MPNLTSLNQFEEIWYTYIDIQSLECDRNMWMLYDVQSICIILYENDIYIYIHIIHMTSYDIFTSVGYCKTHIYIIIYSHIIMCIYIHASYIHFLHIYL